MISCTRKVVSIYIPQEEITFLGGDKAGLMITNKSMNHLSRFTGKLKCTVTVKKVQ